MDGRQFYVWLDGREHPVTAVCEGGLVHLQIGRRTVQVDARLLNAAARTAFRYSLLIDGKSYNPLVETTDEGLRVTVAGHEFAVEALDELEKRLRELEKSGGGRHADTVVKAIMPGLVAKLRIKEGDSVEKDAPLLNLEAMKMENEIKSPVAGTVQKVFVAQGQSVNKGAKLLEIHPKD